MKKAQHDRRIRNSSARTSNPARGPPISIQIANHRRDKSAKNRATQSQRHRNGSKCSVTCSEVSKASLRPVENTLISSDSVIAGEVAEGDSPKMEANSFDANEKVLSQQSSLTLELGLITLAQSDFVTLDNLAQVIQFLRKDRLERKEEHDAMKAFFRDLLNRSKQISILNTSLAREGADSRCDSFFYEVQVV